MLALTMHDPLPLLLERAARYRNLARTVPHDAMKHVLLTLAADYVALVQLLMEQPSGLGSANLTEALASTGGGTAKRRG